MCELITVEQARRKLFLYEGRDVDLTENPHINMKCQETELCHLSVSSVLGALPSPPYVIVKQTHPSPKTISGAKQNISAICSSSGFFFVFPRSDELICMLLSRHLPQEGIGFEMQIGEIITTWLHSSKSALFASVCFHDIIQ